MKHIQNQYTGIKSLKPLKINEDRDSYHRLAGVNRRFAPAPADWNPKPYSHAELWLLFQIMMEPLIWLLFRARIAIQDAKQSPQNKLEVRSLANQ